MSEIYMPIPPKREDEYEEIAWGLQKPENKFQQIKINRQNVGPNDIKFQMKYSGLNELGGSMYPMVPGHELVGTVVEVGNQVKLFKIGDNVGVGCIVDSCLNCDSCQNGDEQYCQSGMTHTYNTLKKPDGHQGGNKDVQNFGGYSGSQVVHEKFAVKIPQDMDLVRCAPILCAGITLYDPLKYYGACEKKNMKIGVIGIGGLGTMGIKLAKALGHTVYAISSSASKESLAKEKGADFFVDSKCPQSMQKYAGTCDLILDTVSAEHQVSYYLGLLKSSGTICLLGNFSQFKGLVTKPHLVSQLSLVFQRKSISGSCIGGIKNTQEVIDLCFQNNIYPDIELITANKIEYAWNALQTNTSDAKRFVIDIQKSLPC